MGSFLLLPNLTSPACTLNNDIFQQRVRLAKCIRAIQGANDMQKILCPKLQVEI